MDIRGDEIDFAYIVDIMHLEKLDKYKIKQKETKPKGVKLF